MSRKQLKLKQQEVSETRDLLNEGKIEDKKAITEKLIALRKSIASFNKEDLENDAQEDLHKLKTDFDNVTQLALSKHDITIEQFKNTIHNNIEKSSESTTTNPKQTNEDDIELTPVESVDTLPKKEKNFIEKTIDGVKKDWNEKNYGKLALKAAGAYAVYRGVKALWSWGKGLFSGGKEQKEGKKKPRYKKVSTWLMAGVGGLALFSGWSKLGGLKKRFEGLFSNKKIEHTDNSTITSKEEQKEQLESSEHKTVYNTIGEHIIAYHSALNPSYEADTLTPLNPESHGVAPMLLDGMYDNIGDMVSNSSLTSEKRRYRREKFNALIAKKSNDALGFLTATMLSIIGIQKEHTTAEGLTTEGRTLVNAHKDELRAMQSQGLMDTKIYLHHIQGELAHSLTKKALIDQGKPANQSAINEALDDDDFQEKYVDKQLNDILSGHHLSDLPALIQQHNLSTKPHPEIVALTHDIIEEKEDLVSDTFDGIEESADILTKKNELTAICEGAISMAEDDDLRENTELRYTDIWSQVFGTDGAIEDRVTESLAANLRWDAFTTEIQKIQTKITNGSATTEDIQHLEELVDRMYQFKQTVVVGGDIMINAEEHDGSIRINILEGGEALYQRTAQNLQGDTVDIVQASVALAPFVAVATHPIASARFALKSAARITKKGGSLALSGAHMAFENQIRRWNYRRSRVPVLNKRQFYKYGKTPTSLYEAFKAGNISLERASDIAAKKSQDILWKKLVKKNWKDPDIFSTNLANNRRQLLKKAFPSTNANYALLEKYVDNKARRELLFTNSNNLERVQDLMKTCDNMLANTNTGLSRSHKTLLREMVSQKKISFARMEQILDPHFLQSINVDGLNPQQLKKLATKVPSLALKSGGLNRIGKQAALLKIGGLDLQDAQSIKNQLSIITTKYQQQLKNFSGTAEMKTELTTLVDELKTMSKLSNKKLLRLGKSGFFARNLENGRGAIDSLTARGSRLGGKIGSLLQSPQAKTLGKIFGAAMTAAEIGFSGYDLYLAIQDNNDLASINPSKHELQVEKAAIGFASSAIGTAAMFIPGAGWVVGASMMAFQFGKEAYYDTIEKYSTNLAEFTRQSKPQISNTIISVLAGRSGVDKGWKESFAEWWTSKDLDYMGKLVGDDAIEGWLRVDELEHLSREQQFLVQFHLAPSKLQHQMYANMETNDTTFSDLEKESEIVFTTMIEKPAQLRYQEIKESVGTTTIQEQQESRNDSLTHPLTLLFGVSGFALASAQRMGDGPAASAEVLNLKAVSDAMKHGQHKAHSTLMQILNGGTKLETHEKTPQTLPGVYHALRRVATDVFGSHLPYDINSIKAYFSEGGEYNTGFYFDGDGEFCISNDGTGEMDDTYTIDESSQSDNRQKILKEIESAVEDDDLISITTGSGETELNQSVGYHILRIFEETKPTVS